MSGQIKIGMTEAIFICVFLITSKVFLSFHLSIMEAVNNGAWLVVLLASLLGVPVFFIIYGSLARHPGKNIIQIGEELVGPYINTIFSLGYLVFFILLTAMTLRQFSERVITGFVGEMPISMAVFSFMAGAVVISYLGLETVARTSRLFASIFLFMLLVFLMMTLHLWIPDYLFPWLGEGLPAIGLTSALKAGLMAEIFIIGLLAGSLPHDRIKTIGLWSLALAGTILLLPVLALQMVFPYPVSVEISLPTFELAKLIHYGRFVQRLETLFMPIWTLSGLISLTIGLYAVSFIISAMLKLPFTRPLVLPAAVIIISVAFVPENISQAVIWDNDVVRNYVWTATIIPPLLLLLLSRFKERNPDDDRQTS